MGMESYSVTVLIKGISINKEGGYQIVKGNSNISLSNIEKKLNSKRLCDKKNEIWIYNNCLEVYIYHENNCFQGLEIKGCISWLTGGIRDIYDIISELNIWCGDLDIYILGKNVWCQNVEQLENHIMKLYEKKISMFDRQYSNTRLKITCGEFYKEMQRRSKWYYKLCHKIRKLMLIVYIV